MLRHGPDFIHYCYKRGITVPARHEMKMQMLAHARASRLALIQAYIYALAVEMPFQDNGAMLQQCHHLAAFLCCEILKSHYMPVWANHYMPIVVGKFVHNDKAAFSAVQNKPFFVLNWIWQTKYALIGFWPKDVINAPRRP